MKKLLYALLAGGFMLSVAGQVSAATASAGHITGYTSSSSGNYPFRIVLDVSTPGCPFFYADMSNTNYQVYVSGLLTAYSMHKSVLITYSVDANGYCNILEYNVSG